MLHADKGNLATATAEASTQPPVQLLSKLFPQTATEKSIEEIRAEQAKKEEEDRKEKESSWKHMKYGYAIERARARASHLNITPAFLNRSRPPAASPPSASAPPSSAAG